MDKKHYIYPDGRMKAKDTAIYTGFSEGTLANWRILGKGPRFIKKNNRVFYYQKDLDTWMASDGFCTTTAQALNGSAF